MLRATCETSFQCFSDPMDGLVGRVTGVMLRNAATVGDLTVGSEMSPGPSSVGSLRLVHVNVDDSTSSSRSGGLSAGLSTARYVSVPSSIGDRALRTV